MSFHVEIIDRPGFLHFRVTGENSPESVRGYLERVRETCIARSRDVVLVEENLSGPSLNTLDMFAIAAEGSVRSRSLFRRIAYVDANPLHPMNDTKFIETVAVNRGMHVRAFATIAEAEAWLTEVEPSRSESSPPTTSHGAPHERRAMI